MAEELPNVAQYKALRARPGCANKKACWLNELRMYHARLSSAVIRGEHQSAFDLRGAIRETARMLDALCIHQR